MAPTLSKKRKPESGFNERVKRRKKVFKKQTDYHSSSSEASDSASEADFQAVNLEDSDPEVTTAAVQTEDVLDEQVKDVEQDATSDSNSDNESGSQDSDDSEEDEDGLERSQRKGPGTGPNSKHVSKRNDPEVFSTSITKILSTKLSQAARKDPVLSRSKQAAEVSSSIAGERLEQKAKAKLRADKKEDLDRGRVKDVLGLNRGEAGQTAEEEQRLRKTAQRGVIKLFNAVRAAQVKGEEAAREERKKGTIGMGHRDEKVNEVSKQGFLELINGKNKSKLIEEA